MRYSFPFVALVLWCAWLEPSLCLDNGLALTPPMGWMSWERYRCETNCHLYPDECISERLIRKTADLLVSEGYAAVGYRYVVIDDCWMARKRGKDGKLKPDPKRFPSGIKALADYVHSKGLKFGIYGDIGTLTCQGYPGSAGHFEVDARTFAEWGVDYVKLDGCYIEGMNIDEEYPKFGAYLNRTGRPMVYSCSWPAYQSKNIKWKSIANHCNLWRLYDDIQDSWSSVSNITEYFGNRSDLVKYAGPGHWNDPDMLIIGNFGLSKCQAQAQMAIWAILAAPLLMSTDLANMKPEYKKILQNRRAIAINQDALGRQGKKIRSFQEGYIDLWIRFVQPVHQNYSSCAVAVVSRLTDGTPTSVDISLMKDLGLGNPAGYKVYDVYHSSFSGQLMMPSAKINVRVVPTGVVFLFMEAVSSHKVKGGNGRLFS